MPVRKGTNRRDDPWNEAWEKAGDGPVAVVDCREEIPCNPCEDACPKGAIEIGENISSPPRYDPAACDGCARCVAVCPGMAVFMLDRSKGKEVARVTVPYEMKDDLRAGMECFAVDKEGKALGKGKIIKVAGGDRRGWTRLVTMEVPEGWALKVRGVAGRKLLVERPEEVEVSRREGEFPFCRCEEISNTRVREIMGEGFHSLSALRRFSRVGLGFCQGRFCQSMLMEELSKETSREPGEVGSFKVRPPVRPVRLSRLGGEDV